MARSLKKGPFVDHHLLKKVEDQNKDGIKKTDQNMVETFDDHPEMIGHTFEVHNGRKFIQCLYPKIWSVTV